MRSLEFVKGLIGVIVFVGATGAALLQLQLRRKIPPLFRGKPAVLLNLHRWLGRAALAAFVLNSTLCLTVSTYPGALRVPRYLAHGLVAALALGLFAAKLVSSRRHIQWGVRHALALGLSLWAAQVVICGIITVHALIVSASAFR